MSALFSVGMSVQLHGLKNEESRYNNRIASVLRVRADGRLDVQLGNGTELCVKHENAAMKAATRSALSVQNIHLIAAEDNAAHQEFLDDMLKNPDLAPLVTDFFLTCAHCKQTSDNIQVCLQVCVTCKAAHYCNAACQKQDQAHEQTCVLSVCTLHNLDIHNFGNKVIAALPHDPDGVLLNMGTEACQLFTQAQDAKKSYNQICAVMQKKPDDARMLKWRGDAEAHDARARDLCTRACAKLKTEAAGWITAGDRLGALKAYNKWALFGAIMLDCSVAMEPVYLARELQTTASRAERTNQDFAITAEQINNVYMMAQKEIRKLSVLQFAALFM